MGEGKIKNIKYKNTRIKIIIREFEIHYVKFAKRNKEYVNLKTTVSKITHSNKRFNLQKRGEVSVEIQTQETDNECFDFCYASPGFWKIHNHNMNFSNMLSRL